MVFKSSWPDAVLTFSFLPGVFVATVAGPAGEAAGELAGLAELVAVWLPLQAPKQMVDRTRTASDTVRDTSRSIFLPFERVRFDSGGVEDYMGKPHKKHKWLRWISRARMP